jgi:hypothetical protein
MFIGEKKMVAEQLLRVDAEGFWRSFVFIIIEFMDFLQRPI